MKQVLVLDANQRSALAVTRSLGKQGISVFTAEEKPVALAGCSRFSKLHFTYPSPRLYPERFADALVGLVKDQHIDILLPMTELTTALLLSHQAHFPEAMTSFPDMKTVDSLADKCSLMRMADSLNIPIPRTWYADHLGPLPCNLEELPYPVVLKPGKSWLPQNDRWSHGSVRFAKDPLEAKDILASDPAFKTHPFMIQECVAGRGKGIFVLYNKGEPIAYFSHRRLREKPPSGGVSVLSESEPVDPVLLSHARALLDKVAWHGVAMVEFKVAEDGTAHLMEINTRFWGSLQLAIDAGVDFPYMLYQLICGERPDPVDQYKTGIRLRWLLGDLDTLYLILRDRQCSSKTKLEAVLDFLTLSPLRTRHEVNRWGDVGPFWCEVRQYLRDIIK